MASVSRSDQTAKVLQIALIITIALLFVLAVLCYFVFASRSDVIAERDKAREDASRLQTENQNLSKENVDIRKIIGAEAGESVDNMNAKFATANDFLGKQSLDYTDLINDLLERIAEKDSEYKKCYDELTTTKADLAREQQEKQLAVAKANEELQSERNRLAAVERTFISDRATFEELSQTLSRSKVLAEERANRYAAVEARMSELRPSIQQALGSSLGEDYIAKGDSPDVQIENFVKQALNKQAEEISEKNAVLTAMGASDPVVQQYVIDTLPQADRVDRYDGRVVAIDSASRSVKLSFPSILGIEPGLVFRVYSDDNGVPAWADFLSTLEVAGFDEDGFVIARIRQESVGNLVQVGDIVATPLWSPGEPMEFVLVGVLELNGDGRDDRDEIVDIIEQRGGKVSEEVRATTTVLVDGGQTAKTLFGEPLTLTTEQFRNLKKQYESAERYNIRTEGLAAFLEWLGVGLEHRRTSNAVDIPGF